MGPHQTSNFCKANKTINLGMGENVRTTELRQDGHAEQELLQLDKISVNLAQAGPSSFRSHASAHAHWARRH